jgi:lysine 6-dehydrogenase
MKVAVIGAGLMGPTLAMDCLNSDDVSEVLLIDIDERRLSEVMESFGNPSRLRILNQSVLDRDGLINALSGFDVAAVALPMFEPLRLIENTWWGAIEAGVNVVDLAGPGGLAGSDTTSLSKAAEKAGVTIVPGCGVEPGLAEMLSAYGMDLLDTVESVDIWCGGLPVNPRPPLNYKIVFGGKQLPLWPGKLKVILDGQEAEVDRYELSGPIEFEGIDHPMEAYYEGFPKTLYGVEKFDQVMRCTESTVRYAGYCEKVNFLADCGLLSREPIIHKGQEIVPFDVFNEIIYPLVELKEGEKDLTVQRVKVCGKKDGTSMTHIFDMVDFYDDENGITSMAKTTSYTAAIVSRMLGSKRIDKPGIAPPAHIVRGKLMQELLEELSIRGVVVEHNTKKSKK